MLPKLENPGERFREWRNRRSAAACSDPRFEVSLAGPEDFSAIYDVVDDAFGVKRPRAVYEWMYEKNPGGVARAVVIREKETGSIASCVSQFPWPIARGADALDGSNGGDSATVRRWQRNGLRKLHHEFYEALPKDASRFGIGWPNSKTVASGKKHQRANAIGVVSRVVLPLRIAPQLESRGWSSSLARLAGHLGDAAQNGWRALLRATADPVHMEVVRRFDSAFDSVTEHCMAWPDYWCPHGAEFLNWRYLDHPVHDYAAIAATSPAGDPVGYSVVRSNGPRAWLMDFVAPADDDAIGVALVAEAIGIAAEAGCETLEFAATPGWRRWSTFRRAGMRERPSDIAFYGAGIIAQTEDPEQAARASADARRSDLWQCVPGDMDGL